MSLDTNLPELLEQKLIQYVQSLSTTRASVAADTSTLTDSMDHDTAQESVVCIPLFVVFISHDDVVLGHHHVKLRTVEQLYLFKANFSPCVRFVICYCIEYICMCYM